MEFGAHAGAWATYLEGGVLGAEGEGGYPSEPLTKNGGVRK